MTANTDSLVHTIGVWVLLALCLAACALILLLPAESSVTDLVYRAF
jgi:hypothetical protein